MGWMAALSDPTRLRLMRLLDRDELGVAELCEVLQLPQSTVSRHLKTLLDGGWLVHRREGTGGRYRLILDELDPARRELWIVARNNSDAWATAGQDELRLRQLLARRATPGEFFAGVAGDWEEIRREQYGTMFDLRAALALLSPNAIIADLGCGTGETVERLAPFVGEAIGVDASPAMLKAARRRLGRYENVSFKQGELTDVPLEDDSCDAALCVLALSYVAEPPRVLTEMRRILKPDGRGVIVDVLAHDRDDFRRRMGQKHRGFAPVDMRRLLESAGFGDVRVVPLPPEPETKGPALFVASGSCGNAKGT